MQHDDTRSWERALSTHDVGQQVLAQVDDCVGELRHVPCPRRGTHLVLAECWMCWCDRAWRRARLSELLAPEALALHPQHRLETLMAQVLEVEDLYVEDGGAVPVVAGTALCRARVTGPWGVPHVEVYSVVLRDVPCSEALLVELNEVNVSLAHSRVFWGEDLVVLSGTVVLDDGAGGQLGCLVDEVCRRADGEGPRLQGLFGGKVGRPGADGS